MIAFTICSNNYLPYARVLCESLKTFNPDWKFVLGLVDKAGPEAWYEETGFDRVIPVEQLQVTSFASMAASYSLVELNTAVKPFYFSYLFDAFPDEQQILYFDPDIQVFAPLERLKAEFEQADILLIPHFSTPHAGQAGIITPESRILQRGLYNLGFIGLKRSENTLALLGWWQEKLIEDCRIYPRKGLFVDQKWIDLAPVYFENVRILKRQGYDVAYWNLYESHLRYAGEEIFDGDNPLSFYHFSAFDKNSADYIDNLVNKYDIEMAGILRMIHSNYLKQLETKGLREFETVRCAYQMKQSGFRKILRTLKRRLIKWLDS